jgi:tetratricopeptide (TPR) repeat protein
LCFLGSIEAATLGDARTRWLKGNYEEAQSDYEELLKEAKNLVPASVGLSRALASQGEYDKALAVIESALKSQPKEASLHARRGELLHLRGRFDEALAASKAALGIDAKSLPALWVQAQVYRDQGDTKEALAEVAAIRKLYEDTVNTPNEIKDPELLVIAGMAIAEYARWKALPDEFQAILDDLYGDAGKFDKLYWPAMYQAGLLLLEKYNRGEALSELDKALKINPSAAEVLVAKGVSALQRFEIKDAEGLAERALKINPNLPEGLRLRADVYLATGDTAKALRELGTAKKINPRDERTLARVAAVQQLQNDEKGLKDTITEAEKSSKKPALFWFDLAERLEERRRFDVAESYYQKAMTLRPELSGPLNGLGMLYMRLGKEAEASKLLDKGFKMDQFNVRVSNMRKVLAHLQTYKELKTKHFVIKFDPDRDGVLANYLAIFLEEVYEELAKKFDYRPAGPIPVEVFRNHDMFSGRTVALPDLHTIGACTGRVITMVSPNEKTSKGEPARKPFNWARVMRHELVHIFNLAQTNYLVPHWFTEGLAVSNEGFPRPPTWNKMLAERVPAGKLLDLGFIRPRDAMEWQLAYCQAQLYIEYIEKKYDPKALGKLLAAFTRGLSTTGAIEEVLKVDKANFEKGYRAYLDEVVKKIQGNASAKTRTLAELEADYKKDNRNADTCGELALKLLSSKPMRARTLAEEALEIRKNHPKANYVLAQLALRAADSKAARAFLEKGIDRENPEPLVLKAVGKIYYEANDFSKAAEVFELGRKADPYDRDWLLELARTYAQTNETKKQISVLKDLVPLDADDLDRRVRLARLLQEQGDQAGAEKYAREAIEIDILSKEARETLIKSLKAQKKEAELKTLESIWGKQAKEKE